MPIQWKNGKILWRPKIAFNAACCTCGGCYAPCPEEPPCPNCSGATVSKYHVTISGLSICTGCVDCPDYGLSVQTTPCTTINGTFELDANGDPACHWTAFSADLGYTVPCITNIYYSDTCDGTPTPTDHAMDLGRLLDGSFLFQIIDSYDLTLMFDGSITGVDCNCPFTITNNLTSCGCYSSPYLPGSSYIAIATGGTASFTPC